MTSLYLTDCHSMQIILLCSMASAATELEQEEELQQSPWSNVWKNAERESHLILEYISMAVNTTRTLNVAAMFQI